MKWNCTSHREGPVALVSVLLKVTSHRDTFVLNSNVDPEKLHILQSRCDVVFLQCIFSQVFL